MTTTTDYFTIAEFRDFASDPVTEPAGTEKYSDDEIDGAQAEAVESLERWARSSWANVTGTDGDGTAADYRLREETFDGGDARYLLQRYPVESIDSIELDEETVDADSYALYLEHGEIRFGSALGAGDRILVVAYRYGHGSTPQAIKRPILHATKALLDLDRGKGRIPRGVTRYTTEGTTFEMTEGTEDVPWPWDLSASDDVRGYWRPVGMTGVRV